MDNLSGRLIRLATVGAAAAALVEQQGLTMVNRPLTDREESEQKIRFSAPCGCGSKKKFKNCCFGRRKG